MSGGEAQSHGFQIRPSAYRQVLQSGVPFHQELELKPGTYTLRLGVLDRVSNKLGSVQASLTIPEDASVSQK